MFNDSLAVMKPSAHHNIDCTSMFTVYTYPRDNIMSFKQRNGNDLDCPVTTDQGSVNVSWEEPDGNI